jgi:peptidoglycan hydrolase-like protein with peptidoglycan-binding domain
MNKNFRIGFLTLAALFIVLFASSVGAQKAHAAVGQSSFGSNGSNVSQIQQFLATNPMIYPAGIVSGHYGPLTQAAVKQFQAAYGIQQVGQVGPVTTAKMNDIMSSGFGLDITAPTMINASVQTTRTTATINWTTGVVARGQVYYDTSPIRWDETTGPFQVAYVSGISAPNNTDVRNTQSVTIQGLQPNTLYYYLTRAIDNSGNISVSMPSTFTTTQ